METEKNELLRMEAFDYVQYSLRRYHNHQLNGCLYMNGRIDEKSLKNAVIASFQDLPQLCASFVKGRFIRTKEPKLFPLEVREGDFGKEDFAAYFAGTTLLEEPYQLKICIFRSKAKDTVAIIINHMLMDGMDFKRYLYLLCELYNLQVKGTAVTSRYIGMARDISWVRKVKAKARTGEHKKVRERISIEGGKIPCFLTEKMPAEKFAMIAAYTKKHGVTVNDYFLTAFYKAVEKTFDYPLKTICCAADLRRYQTAPYGLSNQTGNMFCTVKEAKKMEFEELLQEVHSRMEEEKERGCCLKQIKRLNRAYRYFPRRISKALIDEVVTNPKVTVSNLGVIDHTRLVFGDTETEDCFITGSLKRAPNLQVTISTYREEVTFGINMWLSERERIKLTYFLQVYYVMLMEEVVGH